MPLTARSLPSLVRRVTALAAVTVLMAGCVAAGGQATAGPGSGAPVGSGSPAAPSGFYLRVWQSQALAPQNTFGWLPGETIAEGKFFDGMIAIPAVYPGPIYVGMSSRTISPTAVDAIVAEARKDGLLGSTHDFGGTVPGSVVGHIRLTVTGVTYDLTGPIPGDAHTTTSQPGTADAFGAYWNKLSNLSTWLGSELGQSTPYEPERLAVMTSTPTDASGGIAPNQKPWPLTTPFASFGKALDADNRCAVVSGADLAQLLPAVQSGNALTRFVDAGGVKKSLQARVLLPGEPSPCP